MFGLRWHFGRSTRDAFRDLLDGDLVFFEGDGGDGGDGGGDGGDGSQGGDGDGDGGQGGDGSQGGDGDDDDDGQGAGDGQQETVSLEEARRLRKEARGLRKRAKEAEERLKKLEDKDATDLEKSQRERDEEREARSKAEGEARTLRVQVVATTVGIRPEAAKVAAGLVDWEDIDADDESEISEALKGLKENHGYLFKAGADDVGAGKSHHDKSDDDDVAPGQGRLEKAYADAKN